MNETNGDKKQTERATAPVGLGTTMTDQCFVVSRLPGWKELEALLNRHVPAKERHEVEVALALLVLQAKAEGETIAAARLTEPSDGYNRILGGR